MESRSGGGTRRRIVDEGKELGSWLGGRLGPPPPWGSVALGQRGFLIRHLVVDESVYLVRTSANHAHTQVMLQESV